jgi:hypothetical protein
MLAAREAVDRRSWSHPQEPTGEEWWADVLADPRARKRERRTDLAVKQAFYRLADEKREIILVACSKCDWRAAFARRTDRRSWCGLPDAQPARPPRRNGLSEARLDMGPLRRALRRADRGRAIARPYHGRCGSVGGNVLDVDARLRAPRRPHADARLRADARGRDGGIRQTLAAGVAMAKTTPLTAQERVILFCTATGVSHAAVGITAHAMQSMAIKGFIVHNRESGAYALTDSGRAALLAILGDAGLT